MQIRNGFLAKDILDAEQGELICFELEHGRAWAVILKRAENHILLGVLSAEGLPDQGPFSIQWQYPTPCISYGTEWELEPLPGPECIPGSAELDHTPGVLHALQDGVSIRFGAEPQRPQRSGFSWNFGTGTVVRVNSDASAPVAKWRVWANAKSPRHSGENPLIDFELKRPETA